uniref:Uncharacterized protein n=1 Tax=Zea mays TaxID=4577 RepID=A0A804MWH9_MAIZE
MMRCWKRSPLGKPQRFHRCTRSLNAVCKCKMCTSALSMDGQRWFRCQWWSVDSPLHPRRHRCRWLTWDRLHPLLWTSIWRHHRRLRPLQRQLLVVRHLHRRPWSSGPSLPVVGSLLALLMPREAASSSPAITQVGWPHLPPPIGGPNGPRPGRHVGRLGGRGWGTARQTRRERALRSAAGPALAREKPRRARARLQSTGAEGPRRAGGPTHALKRWSGRAAPTPARLRVGRVAPVAALDAAARPGHQRRHSARPAKASSARPPTAPEHGRLYNVEEFIRQEAEERPNSRSEPSEGLLDFARGLLRILLGFAREAHRSLDPSKPKHA